VPGIRNLVSASLHISKGGGFELINNEPYHGKINPFSRREENES
jgi:hypothetical protein